MKKDNIYGLLGMVWSAYGMCRDALLGGIFGYVLCLIGLYKAITNKDVSKFESIIGLVLGGIDLVVWALVYGGVL